MELVGATGLGGHGLLGLTLGADKEHLAALGHSVHHLVVSHAEELHGLLQVNDMDAVARAENVGTHLGVPAPGLMPEVHAGFQHLLHADVSHCDPPMGLFPPLRFA